MSSLAVVSSSYPLLNIFWTILEVFLWVVWFWILITVFIDIFRSPDLSGGEKALWFVFVLLIPLIGVVVYLIVRGGSMHERSVWSDQQLTWDFSGYAQRCTVAGWQQRGGQTAAPAARASARPGSTAPGAH